MPSKPGCWPAIFYMEILKHRNFNPRLVEWLSPGAAWTEADANLPFPPVGAA
jgi:hypothetical protein